MSQSETAVAVPSDNGYEIEPEIYQRRWAILAVLCTSLMIVIIGNTALNVAIPTLARELEASTSSLQWMVDAYALVFAGLLFTAGTLGDRFGRKGALQAGLAVFLFGTFGHPDAGHAHQRFIYMCLADEPQRLCVDIGRTADTVEPFGDGGIASSMLLNYCGLPEGSH